MMRRKEEKEEECCGCIRTLRTTKILVEHSIHPPTRRTSSHSSTTRNATASRSRRGSWMHISAIIPLLLVFVVPWIQALSIVIVSAVSSLDHLVPLRALAQELDRRGHSVTMALPDVFDDPLEGLTITKASSSSSKKEAAAGQHQANVKLLSLGRFAMTDTKTSKNGNKHHSGTSGRMSGLTIYDDIITFLKDLIIKQRPMYPILHEVLRQSPPDLVILDRYGYVGFDVCHALGLDYVINNPTFLFEMDGPPSYIPPPYTGYTLQRETAWQRAMHLPYRLLYRIRMMQVLEEINHSRSKHGLMSIHSEDQLYDSHLILSNTAFGIEYPRSLPPLNRMVGPLIEASPATEPFGVTAFVSWAAVFAKNSTLALVFFDSKKPLSDQEILRIAEGIVQSGVPSIWILSPHQADVIKTSGLPQPSRTLFIFVSTSILLIISLLRHDGITMVATSCGPSIAQQALSHGKRLLCLPTTFDDREIARRLKALGYAATCRLDDEHQTVPCIKHNFETLAKIKKNRIGHTIAWVSELLKRTGGTQLAADLVLKERRVDLIGGSCPDAHRSSSTSSTSLPSLLSSSPLLQVFLVYALALLTLMAFIRWIWRAILRYFLYVSFRRDKRRMTDGRPFPFSTLCEAAAMEYNGGNYTDSSAPPAPSSSTSRPSNGSSNNGGDAGADAGCDDDDWDGSNEGDDY